MILTIVALLIITVLPRRGVAVTDSAPAVDVKDDLEPQGVGPQARVHPPCICSPRVH